MSLYQNPYEVYFRALSQLLYFEKQSFSGKCVALQIPVLDAYGGHLAKSVKIQSKESNNLLGYDFIFVNSESLVNSLLKVLLKRIGQINGYILEIFDTPLKDK